MKRKTSVKLLNGNWLNSTINRLPIAAFILFILSTVGGRVWSADPEEFKVGFIDSEIIFQNYQGTAELKKQLEEDLKEWENSLREKKKEIEGLYAELESQKLMLSDNARQKKEEFLRAKEIEYESFVTDIFGPNGQARQREKELTKPLLERINLILDRISEEEGFQIIFDLAEAGIIYGRPALDLTQRILEELNQEFTAPEVRGLARKEIYIFPLKEVTTLAQEEEMGNKVTQLLEQALVRTPLFERARGNVGRAMIDIGIDKPDEITTSQVIQVGVTENVDMGVTGKVSKMGSLVEVTIELIDVSKGIVIATENEKSSGDRDEEIIDMVNTLVGKLVKKAQ
jgi:outer membrane protein